MVNNEAIEELKSMTLDELKEFLDAHKQMSFADDSKVRIFCKKHYPEQCMHGFVFGLNMMYVDLSYALYDTLHLNMEEKIIGLAAEEQDTDAKCLCGECECNGCYDCGECAGYAELR